ncbi:hypothetical protein JZO82_00395 [Vagococcus fluvialis]|nr:hypothetical protein [Vagococcus fluvialis]
MSLKKIRSSSDFHSGYGAGSGEVIREDYECPCGKGIVSYEKDDIPGFRDKAIMCSCAECNEKYTFGRGTATEK